MVVERPLLRPALVFERCVLGTPTDVGFAVARETGAAMREWRRLGYVCLAVSCAPGTNLTPERARAEAALQRHVAAALAGYGAALAGCYVMPRPGEYVDADVPLANRYARVLLEAATKHRVDLPRSLCVVASPDALAGARIAGIPCALLASNTATVRAADYVLPDFTAVRALVNAQREQRAHRAGALH